MKIFLRKVFFLFSLVGMGVLLWEAPNAECQNHTGRYQMIVHISELYSRSEGNSTTHGYSSGSSFGVTNSGSDNSASSDKSLTVSELTEKLFLVDTITGKVWEASSIKEGGIGWFPVPVVPPFPLDKSEVGRFQFVEHFSDRQNKFLFLLDTATGKNYIYNILKDDSAAFIEVPVDGLHPLGPIQAFFESLNKKGRKQKK